MTPIGFVDAIAQLANVDLFERDPKTKAVKTGLFVGRPFHLDYDKASVLVTVGVDRNQIQGLRPGATVVAHIDCGRRSLGFVWFHGIWETLEKKVLFWL